MKKRLLSIIFSITVALQVFAGGTFTVTNTNDNGTGSLRAAMQNAITSGSGTVAIQTSGTIILASALPVITTPITITCTNTSGITVSGNNACRVFEVNLSPGTATFKNLNIINGVGAGGGGIFASTSNNGKIALENCTISGCNASGSQAFGGAICSSADVDLLNCTVTGNSAADGGGAIEMIDASGASTLTINHSTVTQNSTPANDIAGGIDVYLNKIIISNSIVGNNTNGNASSARDISLDVSNSNTQASSYNLYTTAPFSTSGTGDLLNKSAAELGLLALANNGGGVKTLALTPASLARNSATGALTTDARGITRDSKPDRGAYEVQAAFDITLSASAINENVAANSIVGTLSSQDNDAGDTFTYSLVSGTGDADNASFNISGSGLRITNSPDFEAKNSYTVHVRTTDQDGFIYEKVFAITVNDLPENMPVMTVHVPTAGGLSAAITAASGTLSGVTNLTVTGTIDARDFVTMRDNMPLLATLDLSGATIAAYSGSDGPATGLSFIYPANGIPDYAFYSSDTFAAKTTLTSITLPSSLRSICTWAFANCTGLAGSLVIPAGVTSIGNNAFYSCSGFTGSLAIPAGVTSIGDDAFYDCSGFTGSLVIPENLTSINAGVFYNCSKLTGFLTIPSLVSSIGSYAFYNCIGLTGTLTLPAGVNSINDGAFMLCRNLNCINVSSVSPIALGASVFNGTPTASIKLVVPSGSYLAYSTTDQWKGFFAVNVPTPTALTGFIAHTGNASASQTFYIGVSPSILDLTVTAPAGYEVRENGIGTFGSTVAFTSATGSIADKMIEVRMASSATPGVISGNVVCSSTGAASQNVAVSGTVSDIPSITTQAVSSIAATTATANGTIVDLGISNPTAYGVCWNTTGNPTVADHIVDAGAATVASAFTAAITGLAPNTTYYLKAFATNSAGTGYGVQVSFTTTNIAPAISYITAQTYVLGTPITALTPTNTGGAVVPMLLPQVSTLAGSGAVGSADGSGTSASFNYPTLLTTDAAGNIYVSDSRNHIVRKITSTGDVSTLVNASAGLDEPAGIVVDAVGNIYVSDRETPRIMKITTKGVITTFAGSGTQGSDNGNGTSASFDTPTGLAIDDAGNLYVADMGNNLIRKITPAGDVSTLAGSGTEGSDNGNGTSASFSNPFDLKVDALGNVYVTDVYNSSIRKITPAGDVTTFVDNRGGPTFRSHAINAGIKMASKKMTSVFVGIAIDRSTGNFYVTDPYLSQIRKITPAGVVSTLAGSGDNGATDGPGETAAFASPMGITVDAAGNVYVADNGNNLIRKITQASYIISPALPAGLSFDGATGTISGTPTALSAATTYTVTTANNGGSSTATISVAVKNPQTITFGTLATKTYGDATFDLAATSTSGLAVSYSSDNTAVATVSGNTVTILGAGTANLTASQLGNTTYAAAANVIQQLTVGKKALTITDPTVITSKTVDGNTTAVVSFSGTLQELITSDLNNVTITATANYDNAIVGINKTITVVYTLEGSASGNYTAPANFVITGAKIVDISSGVDVPTASDAEAVIAYPTQVSMDQSCMVKVTGVSDSDLQGTTLSVYNTQGVCIYHSKKVGLTNSITLPSVQGMYLGRVITGKGKEFQFKVIVTR